MANVVQIPATPKHASRTDACITKPDQPRLNHSDLVRLLQRAYSAERAASFAYIRHAGAVRDPKAKTAIRRIEEDEWTHRRHVFAIMQQYGVPVSRYFETRYYIIGKLIAGSCYVIG